MELRGSTVIVTGASRGIGKATAVELGSRGANVVVVARSIEPVTIGQETWSFLGADDTRVIPGTVAETVAAVDAAGGTALGVVADVTNAGDRQRLVDAAVEAFGRIDALVNNACYMLGPGFWRSVPELAFEDWKAQVDTNLNAPVALIAAVVPHLRAAGGGVIVNMTSPEADLRPPTPGSHLVPQLGIPLAYAVTKAAISRLSNLLAAQFLDEHIAVVDVDTRFTRTESVEFLREIGMPVDAAPTADIPARAIAHILALDVPMTLTGQIVVVPEVATEWGLTDPGGDRPGPATA